MDSDDDNDDAKLGSAAKRTGKGEGPRLARDIPNGVGGWSGLPVPYG